MEEVMDLELESTPEWNSLPSELLGRIFYYLDAIDLCRVGKVCTRWLDMVRSLYITKVFEHGFAEYWDQGFRDLYPLMDYDIFSSLIGSVTCLSRFIDDVAVPEITYPNNYLSFRRLRQDARSLPVPEEGVYAYPCQNNYLVWTGRIRGPQNSPYENGIFYLRLHHHLGYPIDPPRVNFITKIFHPAVNRKGEIALDLLGPEWGASFTVSSLLISIMSCLTDRDQSNCEDSEAGRLFKENKVEFDRIAREWTEKYAQQHLTQT